VFFVNEGNFSDKNGSLSFLDNKTDVLTNQLVEAENAGAKLGGTFQSAKIYNDKIYAITQSEDKITVLDANTLKIITTITGIVNPYDIAFSGDKAYVTSWGAFSPTYQLPDASVKVINLTTNAVIKTIGYGTYLLGITEAFGKIYVANADANQVSIIETVNDTKSTNIPVSDYPARFVTDRNGKLWVMCSGLSSASGALQRINPATNAIEKTVANLTVQGYGYEKLATYEDKIFYMEGKNVFSVNIDTPVAPITPTLTTTYKLYGMGVSKVNGDIFVGEATFTRSSEVGKYTKTGTFIKKYTAGIGTSTFVER
jgi:YVTN family beta-propeller protein